MVTWWRVEPGNGLGGRRSLDVKGARVLAERIEQERRRRAATSACGRGPGGLPTPLEVGRRWNYRGLRELVEGAAGRSPGEVEEWMAFLDGLQGQVEEDGFLPASFDRPVTEVLRELLLATGGL
jgi:hypothetical protein